MTRTSTGQSGELHDRPAPHRRTLRRRGREFHAYQYLVVARPVPAADYGLTSIVIVTHNQLEYTRQCLDSIRRLTDEPYELIVVDNASTDGTVEYLRASRRGAADRQRRRTAAFPPRPTRGSRRRPGEQILLLNNDTIVTTGWLGRMLRALHSDSDDRPGRAVLQLRQRAAAGPSRLREPGRPGRVRLGLGQGPRRPARRDVHRLVGFCLLIRRAVIDAIGLLRRAVRHRLLRGRRLLPAGDPGRLSRGDRRRRVRPPLRRADVRRQRGRLRGGHARERAAVPGEVGRARSTRSAPSAG